jgi:hypothetical protein
MAMAANERRETKYERTINLSANGSDLARARDIARQLGLKGEINWPASQQPGELAFSVSRPKDASQVRVDLNQSRAFVQHFDNSGLATFRIFHTFSGSRYNDTARRDWIVTTLWVAAMDSLAAGLIVMVFGSYYMWYRLKQRHTIGLIALGAGVLSCAAFFTGFIR